MDFRFQRIQSIVAGASWQQEPEDSDPAASAVKKQEVMNTAAQPLFRTPVQGTVPPMFRVV